MADDEYVQSQLVISAAAAELPDIPDKFSMLILNFVQGGTSSTAKIQVKEKTGTVYNAIYSAELAQNPQLQRNMRIGSNFKAQVTGASSGSPAFVTYKLVHD